MTIENHQREQAGDATRNHSVKLRLLFGSLIVFVLSVGFNTMFTTNSLEKLYIETNVSEYLVVGQDLNRNIENGLYYGKSLFNFHGMDTLITRVKSDILSITNNNDAQGIAPEKIQASYTDGPSVYKTRPVCTYPEVAVYKGEGDPYKAENFICGLPTW